MQHATCGFATTGDGIRIRYRLDGPRHLPTLALSNSIGTDLHMWDAQIPQLTRHFRVLRHDARGHGRSDAPPAPYSLDRLGHDVVELLDALELQRVHFLGLPLGGFVAQWLGVHVPARIDRLVLSNTAAWLGPPRQWNDAIAAVMARPDMSQTAEMFVRNWFPAAALEEDDKDVQAFRRTLLAMSREGIAGSWAAIRDADLRRTIALIPCPTLVIAGEHDRVTTVAHGEEMASTIPGARLRVLPTVHLPNVERPEDFANEVLAFLLERPAPGSGTL